MIRKILPIAALILAASCSNPAGPSGSDDPAGDNYKSRNSTLIEGVHGEHKDTLFFDPGKYNGHLYYLENMRQPDYFELRTEAFVNYDEGKMIFGVWGEGLKYKVIFFE